MKAYKFLLPGAVGPFSGFAWPTPDGEAPGPWVGGVGAGLVRCRNAIHACRVLDLPWWIEAELWTVELAEPVRQVRHKLFAPQGRLLALCERWDALAAEAFARSCAAHAAAHAAATAEALGASAPAARLVATMAGDAAQCARTGLPATAAYVAAHAAGQAGGEASMAAERRRQSAWLAEHAGLERPRG